jgi:hypothetical protein
VSTVPDIRGPTAPPAPTVVCQPPCVRN